MRAVRIVPALAATGIIALAVVVVLLRYSQPARPSIDRLPPGSTFAADDPPSSIQPKLSTGSNGFESPDSPTIDAPGDGVATSGRAARRRARAWLRFVDFTSREAIPMTLFHAWGEANVHRANEEGELVYRSAEPGRVEFEAVADGYCLVRGVIETAPSKSDEPFAVPMVRSSPIEGQVVSTSGDPIGFATVSAGIPEGRGEPREPVPTGFPEGWTLAAEETESRALTSGRGRFRLPGMVPGSNSHVVRATRPGYFDGSVPIVARGPGVPVVIEVALEPEPPPPGVVAGRVTLNGQPIEAEVEINTPEGPDLYTETDATGAYRIEGVLPLSVVVTANPVNWLGRRPRVEGNRTRVEVDATRETLVDLHLVVTLAEISGTVRSFDGKPEEGIEVVAQSQAAIVATTDAAGRYSIEVPDLGEPYMVSVNLEVGSPSQSGVFPGTAGVDFVTPEQVELELDVRDAASGAPISGFRVYVRATGTQDWDGGAPAWRRSAAGYSVPALRGPIDIRVKKNRYHSANLTGVATEPEGVTRIEVRLQPK